VNHGIIRAIVASFDTKDIKKEVLYLPMADKALWRDYDLWLDAPGGKGIS